MCAKCEENWYFHLAHQYLCGCLVPVIIYVVIYMLLRSGCKENWYFHAAHHYLHGYSVPVIIYVVIYMVI